MKRFFGMIVMAMMALSVMAQKDVTTFLGIPVDGTKSEMKRKLMVKGFVPKGYGEDEHLEGQFNGSNVILWIATNNNKVCRIMVKDAYTQEEGDIKIRFNTLVKQFENNKRYFGREGQTLSEDEDISYEMSVHSKRYEAFFLQRPILKYEELLEMSDKEFGELAEKKLVWFTIHGDVHDGYSIAIYYDNVYNQANGEDL